MSNMAEIVGEGRQRPTFHLTCRRFAGSFFSGEMLTFPRKNRKNKFSAQVDDGLDRHRLSTNSLFAINCCFS